MMPARPGQRKRNRKRPNHSDDTVASDAPERPETTTSLAGDSPVLAVFKDAARKLMERRERHERLVKLSGDISVESKKIIFLLLSPIIPEHLHSKAVTAGFQDYVGARTFLSLMSDKRIITYPEVQKEFEYNITEDDQQQCLVTFLPKFDYMLGLVELTGVLMRKAVNSISSRDIEEFQAWDVIRQLYTGFLGLSTGNRVLFHKLETICANVDAADMAMYTLYFRGGEAPPKLVSPATPEREAPRRPSDADDEGYCQDCT